MGEPKFAHRDDFYYIIPMPGLAPIGACGSGAGISVTAHSDEIMSSAMLAAFSSAIRLVHAS